MLQINSLNHLIQLIAKLPGLGPRSARRLALHLVKNTNNLMLPLADALLKVAQEAKHCEICNNIDVQSPCHVCSDHSRDKTTICVVEDVADLWAVERGNIYKGTYHVLGGVLSALDGKTPDKLNFETLKLRVANNNVQEVIIATNSTLEGQTTGFYIVDLLKPFNVKTSRLASGIPIGGELDYMDEGTLLIALKSRKDF